MAKLNEENQTNAGPIEAEAGGRREFPRKTRLLALGGLFIALCAASSGRLPAGSRASDRPDVQREPARPTAREVKATLTQDYRAPERHTVTEVKEEGAAQRGDVAIWVRHYDGIELLTRPRTVLVEGQRWETRRHRELAEPEPARLAEVISAETAAERAGLREPGKVTTRLVYMPEFIEVPKVAGVQNAMDVETVITGYRLAVEVVDHGGRGIVWVDAYNGEVISKDSLVRDLTVRVPGRHYPSVLLDVTPKAGVNLLADPVRYSLLNSSGQPVNGQGAARGQPLNTNSPLSYWNTDTANSGLIDGAFALQQSWDFFARAFGRRGLRDLSPSTSTYNNEAVLYLEPTLSSLNAGMTMNDDGSATGLIRINSGHPQWRSLMNLESLGHEWTHGVFSADVNHVPNFFKGEQGGIEEATSNFFGKLIGMRGRQVLAQQQTCGILCPDTVPPFVEIPNTADDWIMGNEDPTTPRDITWVYLCRPSRSGSTPFHDQFLDEWKPGMATMDAHPASGPINRMHCLLARGILPNVLIGSGDPDLKTPLVPKGFTGLGSEQTARIWYQALTFMHGYPPPLNFSYARQASLDAATVLYGKDSAQYKAVEDAFAAIRVGSPADRAPVITSIKRDDTLPKKPKFTVQCTDMEGVDHVEVRKNGVVLQTDNTAPYEFVIDTSTWLDGHETLVFQCMDVLGLSSLPVDQTVTVDSTGPTFQFGVYGAGYSYRVEATNVSDLRGIKSVQLSGGLIFPTFSATLTQPPYAYVWALPKNTPWRTELPFWVIATDTWGNETSAYYGCRIDSSSTTPTYVACVRR